MHAKGSLKKLMNSNDQPRRCDHRYFVQLGAQEPVRQLPIALVHQIHVDECINMKEDM